MILNTNIFYFLTLRKYKSSKNRKLQEFNLENKISFLYYYKSENECSFRSVSLHGFRKKNVNNK